VGIRCADHVTPFYPQKLVLTPPTDGGHSVGIVHSQTKATEFFFSYYISVLQLIFPNIFNILFSVLQYKTQHVWQKLTSQFPTELHLQLYRPWEWIKTARTCIWLCCVKAANKQCLHTHTRAHAHNGINHVKFLENYVHCWTKMQSYPILHCLHVTLLMSLSGA